MSDPDQVAGRVAAYGILPEEPDGSAESEDTENTDTANADAGGESDERTSADASTDDGEQDGDADASGDDGDSDADGEGSDDGDSDDSNPQIEALKAQVAKLENATKEWQSRYDRLANQQYGRTPPLQETTEGDDDLSSLPDDDVLTGKQLKDLLARRDAKQTAQQKKSQSQQERQAWVSSQPDIREVTQYMTEKGLYDESSPLRGLPTDEIGMYHAVKAMMLDDRTRDFDAKLKSEVDKARAEERKKLTKPNKGKVPPTGGSGAPQRNRSHGESLEPATESDRELLKFFQKIDPNTNIVSARRG